MFSLNHLDLKSSCKPIQKIDFANFNTISIVPEIPLITIETNAFASSLSLVEINIPETVTSIGNSVFEECYLL